MFQRGRVSLDPTWKRPRTEVVVCLAVRKTGQMGERRAGSLRRQGSGGNKGDL